MFESRSIPEAKPLTFLRRATSLELVQGPHVETLNVMELRGNEFGFFDPRSKHAAQKVVLTANHFASFQPGEALLRATATGRPQWGRTPPPVVREMKVEIGQQ